MPIVQPAGAYRTFQSGQISDAQLSPDGATLYTVSGTSVAAIDVASGQILQEYDLGEPLGAMDLSRDGRYLSVVVHPPFLSATSASLFRIDTATDQVSFFDLPLAGNIENAFYDVAILDGGKALLSQQADAPLIQLDFADGSTTAVGPNLGYANLVASQDHSEILLVAKSSMQTLHLFVPGTGITATHIGLPDPYGGASVPPSLQLGAISPAGDLIIQDVGLKVFDESLNPILSLRDRYPYLGDAGMAFSASGDILYLAFSSVIVALDTASWEALAVYPAEGSVSGSMAGYAEVLQVSDDGRYLTVIGTDGVEVIDLSLAVPIATPGNDVLTEGEVMLGLAGDDTLGGDGYNFMIGGEGDDTYLLDQSGENVTELPGEGYDTVLTTANQLFLSDAVEAAVFTGTGDVALWGNDEDNVLTGGGGSDSLFGSFGNDEMTGLGGNDTLDGGAGADTLTGGKGDDIYFVDDAGDVVIELSGEGADEVRSSAASYTLHPNVEWLTGLDDSGQLLTGNELDNRIEGAFGADTMAGGDGDDDFHVNHAGDTVVEAADEGHDTVYATVNGVVLAENVEDLQLVDLATEGTGNDLANVLTGGSMAADDFAQGTFLRGMGGDDRITTFRGNDTLDGGAGADTLIGGQGNDTYYLDTPEDVVVENPGEGRDRIFASFDFTLDPELEDLFLIGQAVDGTGNTLGNAMVGNDRDNTLRGLEGDDVLIGEGGDDSLYGGGGQDTAIFDGNLTNYDIVREGDGFRIVDRRESNGDGNDFAQDIEIFRFATGDVAAEDLVLEPIRLAAFEDFAGGVGGTGEIFGTNGFQDLTLLGGANDFAFDGSFGRGGDVLRLAGDASAYTAAIVGTGVELTDGTSRYSIPIGQEATYLVFADGVRALRFDAGQGEVLLGSQAIGGIAAPVTAPDDGSVLPTGADPAVSSRVVLFAEAEAGVDGDYTLFGTNAGAETVRYLGGDISLDGSFGRGGDEVVLTGAAENHTAYLSGTSLVLVTPEGEVTVPVGTAGMDLAFAGDVRTLAFDVGAGAVLIGEQAITATSAGTAQGLVAEGFA